MVYMDDEFIKFCTERDLDSAIYIRQISNQYGNPIDLFDLFSIY